MGTERKLRDLSSGSHLRGLACRVSHSTAAVVLAWDPGAHNPAWGCFLPPPRLSGGLCWGWGFGMGACAVGGCSLSSQLRPAVPCPLSQQALFSRIAGRIPALLSGVHPWLEEEAALGHLPGEVPWMRGGVWLSSGLPAERDLALRASPGRHGLGLGSWPWRGWHSPRAQGPRLIYMQRPSH